MSAPRWKQVAAAISKTFTILLTITALLLTFFLVQSKLTGSDPAVFGHKIYIVMSGSMEPALKTGSIVAVHPLPAEQLEPGDIITYRGQQTGTLTTHRVEEVSHEDGLHFHTRGDANNVRDPLPVAASQVVGKVALTIPYAGYLFAYTRTARGQIILFGLAVLLVAGDWVHSAFVRRRSQKPDDQVEEVAEEDDSDPLGRQS